GGIDRDYTVGSCARPAYAVPDVCAGRGIAPDRAGAAGPSQLIGDLGGVACTARHLSCTVYVAVGGSEANVIGCSTGTIHRDLATGRPVSRGALDHAKVDIRSRPRRDRAGIHNGGIDGRGKVPSGKVPVVALAGRVSRDQDADHRVVEPRLIGAGGRGLAAGDIAIKGKCAVPRPPAGDRNGLSDGGAGVPDLGPVYRGVHVVIEPRVSGRHGWLGFRAGPGDRPPYSAERQVDRFSPVITTAIVHRA